MKKTATTLAAGTIVTLPARKDGVPHRHGNDAKWSVVSDNNGIAFLRLVGGTDSDTCGAASKSLTVVR